MNIDSISEILKQINQNFRDIKDMLFNLTWSWIPFEGVYST